LRRKEVGVGVGVGVGKAAATFQSEPFDDRRQKSDKSRFLLELMVTEADILGKNLEL
jgi:hypothetical protein